MNAIDIIFGNAQEDRGEDALSKSNQIDYTVLYNYIRSMLGAPITPVELTDEQLSNILLEAVAEYNKWRNFEENIIYADLPSQNQNEGYEIPSEVGPVRNIIDIIIRPRLPFGYLAADPDMSNAIYLQYFFQRYGRPGHMGFLSDYYLAITMLKDTSLITGTEFRWEILNRRIYVYPKPYYSLLNIGILYKSSISMEDVNNDMFIRKYCLAKAKILLGTIRSTFGGIIPAGTENITLSYGELIQQGQKELDDVKNEMKSQSEPALPFIG